MVGTWQVGQNELCQTNGLIHLQARPTPPAMTKPGARRESRGSVSLDALAARGAQAGGLLKRRKKGKRADDKEKVRARDPPLAHRRARAAACSCA